jgi:hypothetical protein
LNKKLRITTLLLITGLIVLSSFWFAKAAPPPQLPMNIKGYVLVQTTNGTNMTSAGLNVTARQNTTIFNINGSMPTDVNGYYSIGVSGPTDGASIDIWVQEINVTRMIFHPAGIVDENLTITDVTSPIIQVVWPPENGIVMPNQTLWVNATVMDDLLINETSIKMTLNQTPLTWTFDNTTGLLSSQAGTPTPGSYVANVTVSDIVGNTATKAWSFTAVLDTTPPVIGTPTQVPSSNVQPNQTVTVSTIVTDTESGVKNVTLSYNNGTATWYDLPMSLTSGSWQVTIPGMALNTNVKYNITAYDNAGNKAVNDNGTVSFKYLIVPEFLTVTALIMLMTFTAILTVLVKRRKTIKT